MQLTVDRKTWRCGQYSREKGTRSGGGPTNLLNKEGYRCCLGQVCSQLGIDDQSLLMVLRPISTDNLDFSKFEELGISMEAAIFINDDPSTSLQEKEDKLISLFKESGHDLSFSGEYNT